MRGDKTRNSLSKKKYIFMYLQWIHNKGIYMQLSAFKLSLGIVAPCPFLVPRSHGAGDPTVLATHAVFHANLNIILRIMALMLSMIRVLYTYELSTLMIEHKIRSGFFSTLNWYVLHHLDYFATFSKQDFSSY